MHCPAVWKMPVVAAGALATVWAAGLISGCAGEEEVDPPGADLLGGPPTPSAPAESADPTVGLPLSPLPEQASAVISSPGSSSPSLTPRPLIPATGVSRPTAVPINLTRCEEGVCLTVDLVFLQEDGRESVLLWVTVENLSASDVVYSYGDFTGIDDQGISHTSVLYTPSADVRTVRPTERQTLYPEFPVSGERLREVVWRPAGLPEVRVPLVPQ